MNENFSKWRCRIGRIRPKAGGAVVSVLDAADVRARLIADGRFSGVVGEVRSDFPEGVAGYALVVWSASGAGKSYYCLPWNGPIPARLVPAYCHDRLTEDIVTDRAAEAVANRVIDERFR